MMEDGTVDYNLQTMDQYTPDEYHGGQDYPGMTDYPPHESQYISRDEYSSQADYGPTELRPPPASSSGREYAL